MRWVEPDSVQGSLFGPAWRGPVLAGLLLCGVTCGGACSRRELPHRLRAGVALQPPSALVLVAEAKGYFRDEGLDLTVVEYISGKRGLEGLAAAEVDVATAAEVPFVVSRLSGDDFVVLAAIGVTDSEPRIVARRQRIETPDDLRGRRIGTQRGSAVHFFLHLFLTRHGIGREDAEIVFLAAEDIVPALQRGEIDAFSMREPFVSRAVLSMGEGVHVFEAPGLYQRTEVVVATREATSTSLGALDAFLRAVRRAERFAMRHREESIGIVAARLGMEREEIDQAWGTYRWDVKLDQALVLSMEDIARWLVRGGLVEARELPNVLEGIDAGFLRRIDPSVARIIEGERSP